MLETQILLNKRKLYYCQRWYHQEQAWSLAEINCYESTDIQKFSTILLCLVENAYHYCVGEKGMACVKISA